MLGKYKVITLCGSTRFKEQFLEAQKRLTRAVNYLEPITTAFGNTGKQ